MKNSNTNPTKFTLKEKLTIFSWKNILIPLVETIGGKAFPNGIVTEHKYGELENEKLDSIPSLKEAKTSKIAIVHIHGGGWVSGSKGRFYSKPILKFAGAGYHVFSINYPLAPKHPHPHSLRSILKALAFIKKNYSEYEYIHIVGDSAGGHLAMMTGLLISNPKLLAEIDTIDVNLLPKIKTISPLYGVLDRISWIEDGFPSAKLFIKCYAGELATDKNYIPKTPITPMDITSIEVLPPTYIAGAGKDKLLRSSVMYAEYLEKSFNNVEVKVYEGAAHGFFSFGKGCEELSDDLLKFFDKNA